jgi:hypothetical protein
VKPAGSGLLVAAIVAALVAAMAAGGRAGLRAQTASPTATPAGGCDLALLPPLPPLPTDDGTPEPRPTVLPVAVTAPAKTLTAAAINLLDCAADGQELALAAILRAQLPPVASPDWLDNLRNAAPIDSLQVSNTRADFKGNGSVDVTWRLGPQIRMQHWRMVAWGASWQLTSAVDLPDTLPGAAVGLEVRIDASGLALPRTSVTDAGGIEFRVVNETSSDLRFVVLSLPAGAVAPPDLSNGPPGRAVYAGEASVTAGETGFLALQDVPRAPMVLLLIALPEGRDTGASVATVKVEPSPTT